jgi:pimeloyl-ACP methyl ester carboxylesterase
MADDDARGPVASVVTRDGRTLTYLVVGDPQGPLLVHHQGGPGSRLEARLLAQAATELGLRLSSLDRPGVGRSTPQRSRSLAGWAGDVAADEILSTAARELRG